jgi:hypothetical protein
VIGKDAKVPKPNIVGMPVGTVVPQVCLWEMYQKQRGSEAGELFFQPGPFLRTVEQAQARKLGVGVGPADTPILITFPQPRLASLVTTVFLELNVERTSVNASIAWTPRHAANPDVGVDAQVDVPSDHLPDVPIPTATGWHSVLDRPSQG